MSVVAIQYRLRLHGSQCAETYGVRYYAPDYLGNRQRYSVSSTGVYSEDDDGFFLRDSDYVPGVQKYSLSGGAYVPAGNGDYFQDPDYSAGDERYSLVYGTFQADSAGLYFRESSGQYLLIWRPIYARYAYDIQRYSREGETYSEDDAGVYFRSPGYDESADQRYARQGRGYAADDEGGYYLDGTVYRPIYAPIIQGCEATLTGDNPTGTEKCYNTFQSCQDRENFRSEEHIYRFSLRPEPNYRPLIESVEIRSGELHPEGLGGWASAEIVMGESLAIDQTGDDRYGSDRSGGRTRSGSYWGRFIARQTGIRSWYADLDIVNSETDTVIQATRWKVDTIQEMRGGQVTLKLTSPVRDYFKNRTFPELFEEAGRAAPASDDEVIGEKDSFIIHDIPDNWSVNDFVRTGTEIVKIRDIRTLTDGRRDAFIGTANAAGTSAPSTTAWEVGSGLDDDGDPVTAESVKGLGGDNRGVLGTEAASYSSTVDFTLCNIYDQSFVAMIRDILLHVDVDVADMDSSLFSSSPPGNVAALITEEKDVEDLLAEICMLGQFGLLWDIYEQKFRIISETIWDQPSRTVTEKDFILDSFNMRFLPGKQITRSQIRYGLANPFESSSYTQTREHVGNNEDGLGLRLDDTMETALLGYSGSPDDSPNAAAVRAVSGKVNRYQDLPLEIEMNIKGEVAANFSIGDIVDIQFKDVIQNFDGERGTFRCMLISMDIEFEKLDRKCKFLRISPPSLQDPEIPYVILPQYYRDYVLFDDINAPLEEKVERNIDILSGTVFYGVNSHCFNVGNFHTGSKIHIRARPGVQFLGLGGQGGEWASYNDLSHNEGLMGKRGLPAFAAGSIHTYNSITVSFRNDGALKPGGGGGGSGEDYTHSNGDHFDGGDGGDGANNRTTLPEFSTGGPPSPAEYIKWRPSPTPVNDLPDEIYRGGGPGSRGGNYGEDGRSGKQGGQFNVGASPGNAWPGGSKGLTFWIHRNVTWSFDNRGSMLGSGVKIAEALTWSDTDYLTATQGDDYSDVLPPRKATAVSLCTPPKGNVKVTVEVTEPTVFISKTDSFSAATKSVVYDFTPSTWRTHYPLYIFSILGDHAPFVQVRATAELADTGASSDELPIFNNVSRFINIAYRKPVYPRFPFLRFRNVIATGIPPSLSWPPQGTPFQDTFNLTEGGAGQYVALKLTHRPNGNVKVYAGLSGHGASLGWGFTQGNVSDNVNMVYKTLTQSDWNDWHYFTFRVGAGTLSSNQSATLTFVAEGGGYAGVYHPPPAPNRFTWPGLPYWDLVTLTLNLQNVP